MRVDVRSAFARISQSAGSGFKSLAAHTVTVSGLPQADDHAFVTEMIGAFLSI